MKFLRSRGPPRTIITSPRQKDDLMLEIPSPLKVEVALTSSPENLPNIVGVASFESPFSGSESATGSLPSSVCHKKGSQSHVPLVEAVSPAHKDDHYVSKDQFSVLETLLTPRFLADFKDAEAKEAQSSGGIGRSEDWHLRRSLIQRELDALLEATERTLDLEGDGMDHELEPEAVEALGVAANVVAYQKKYYDVATSQFIYVPSVAYCIMDGSLLEEASKHYFGKSGEFLVTYAAELGSTILQNRLPHVLQLQGPDSTDGTHDYVTRTDENEADTTCDTLQEDAMTIANSCWGVSPTARSSPTLATGTISASAFFGEEDDIDETNKSSSVFSSFGRHLTMLVIPVLVGGLSAHYVNTSYNAPIVSLEPVGDLSAYYVDTYDHAPIVSLEPSPSSTTDVAQSEESTRVASSTAPTPFLANLLY